MASLTVWSVCVGDKYTDEDVLILRDMVRRNMSLPHNFQCLSDRQIADVDCFIPPEKWPGWWSKILLFRYATGQVLYLDLDTVIVGPLHRLLSKQLSCPANWAQSGHGGCQSSVMSWHSDYERLGWLADIFDPERLDEPERGNCGAFEGLWGDQELLTRELGDPGEGRILPMEHVYSFKYHCLAGPPADTSVCCFHGQPKPADVQALWVKNARLSTATQS